MSTKIYNGYISDLNINQLLIEFKKEVPNFNSIKNKIYYQYKFEEIIKYYDGYQFGHIKNDKLFDDSFLTNNMNENQKLMYNIGRIINGGIEEKIRDIERYHRHPDIDYTINVSVFPLKDKTLILRYSDNHLITQHFNSLPYVSEYIYQNQTDPPDDIPEELWAQRHNDWDEVLGGDGWGLPCQNGYNFVFNTINQPFVDKEELGVYLDYANTKEPRAKHICLLNYMKERLPEKVSTSQFMVEHRKYRDEYTITDDYKKEISYISENLKTFTIEDIFSL